MNLTVYRVGHCKQCGRCCDKSLSQPEKWAAMARTDDPDVRVRADGRFSRRVCKDLGPLVEAVHNRQVDIPAHRDCGIYESRPQLCRDFPRNPCDIRLIPECGYRFEVRCE